MRHCFIGVGILLMIAAVGPQVLAGELTDHGPQGEFFLDEDTGDYWFDPEVFAGWDRGSVDQFVTMSRLWSWATSAQVDALVGCTAPAGGELADAMGTWQITISGYRWLGFYEVDTPDGWLIQASAPPFTELNYSGYQNGTSGLDHGAWVIANEDPETALRLENIGDAGQFFYNQYTRLYWHDPAAFEGMSRAEIEAWLLANPAWRWASGAEVQALVGMISEGDVPLVEILGDPQITLLGGRPRWVGYYAQETQPDGMLLQAELLTPYTFASWAGTQVNVHLFNPGAWIVTEDVAARTTVRTWGSVKTEFR